MDISLRIYQAAWPTGLLGGTAHLSWTRDLRGVALALRAARTL